MRQDNFKVIGLTGGIATGKSTVSNIIRNNGYKVIDADKIARDVVQKGMPAYKEIIRCFGDEVLCQDKNIDRKRLGSIIFKEELLRKKLNDIVHPYVFKTIKKLIVEYGYSQKYVFVDVPLLIEEIDNFKKYGICFHEIWLVYADERTQLDRLIIRDSISQEEGRERIKSQMPIELKREYATKIIDNIGDLKTLEEQMEKIIDEII